MTRFFFFLKNCPHHVFFFFFLSHTLLSLSVSSPRGECQQEVGLGTDMKQKPARWLESCLTLHSKNEPAAFISPWLRQNKMQPLQTCQLLNWSTLQLPMSNGQSEIFYCTTGELPQDGERQKLKGGSQHTRCKKEGKNPESPGFLSTARKGVEASSAQPQSDS